MDWVGADQWFFRDLTCHQFNPCIHRTRGAMKEHTALRMVNLAQPEIDYQHALQLSAIHNIWDDSTACVEHNFFLSGVIRSTENRLPTHYYCASYTKNRITHPQRVHMHPMLVRILIFLAPIFIGFRSPGFMILKSQI